MKTKVKVILPISKDVNLAEANLNILLKQRQSFFKIVLEELENYNAGYDLREEGEPVDVPTHLNVYFMEQTTTDQLSSFIDTVKSIGGYAYVADRDRLELAINDRKKNNQPVDEILSDSTASASS